MVVCVLIPRFALLAAVERRALLEQPLALAPEPGATQVVGEVSGAAEGFGVRPGMALSEALGRCPQLGLIAPDPTAARSAWEGTLERLEGIGAEVEPGRPGEAFFGESGLRDLLGGGVEQVMARARQALGGPVRLGAAPSRFCAFAAAHQSRVRRPLAVRPSGVEAFLSPLPALLLLDRLAAPGARPIAPDEAASLVADLERLGIDTLGLLAGLPAGAVADRFGPIGLRARDLACGADTHLRPRRPARELFQSLELPEVADGTQLDRALELLVDRLLADPARRGRSFRSLRIEARLATGGSWSIDVVLRSATGSTERLLLALGPKLGRLPGPARALGLRAIAFAPPSASQDSLTGAEDERRRDSLSEAIRQTRAACGPESVLKVLDVDAHSRVPERRQLLTPFPPPSR